MGNSRFDLSGKTALVTGGAGVLGKAMVKGLLEHNAFVIILGRTQEKIRKTIDEFKEQGFGIDGYTADVLDSKRLREVSDDIIKKYKKIDILVNAAGGQIKEAVQEPGQTIFDIEPEAIKRSLDLNLMGTVYPSLIFGKLMTTTGSGSIVNISSMAADRAVTRVLGYSMAKAGVDSLTKWMSMELAHQTGDKIRVNAIAPGFFISEQNKKILLNEDGSFTQRTEKIIEHTPSGRLGKPEELISTLIWLCSDASKFVNGTIVEVDGGFSKFSGV